MNSKDINIIKSINYYTEHENELKTKIISIINKYGYINILYDDELLDKLDICDKSFDNNQIKNLLYYDFKDLKYPCIHGIIYRHNIKNKIISTLITYSYFLKLLSTGLFLTLFSAYILFNTTVYIFGASLFMLSFIIIILIKKNYKLIIKL